MTLAAANTLTLLPGIYPGQPRADYDAAEGMNFSRLRELLRSPAHFRAKSFSADKGTNAMKLGRCAHIATFEPERFRGECAIWTEGRRAGRAWDSFVAANAGRELLTAEEAEYCDSIQAAVRFHPIAGQYVSKGKAEVSMFWTHRETAIAGLPGFEMACKGRPDFITSAGVMVDLKTTRDASPDAFGKACWNLGYHIQAAFYADGYAAATGKEAPPFVVVAAETSAPHVIQVYSIPEEIMGAGRQEYRRLLNLLHVCRSENHFPGYSEEVMPLTLPKWAMPRSEEDDAEDLGISINQQGE